MAQITITGKVKEVRTFLSFVTLYLSGSDPEKYRGKVVKFSLDNNNCQNLLKWSQLEEGAEIAITRNQNDGIPRDRKYTFKVLKSDVIDMDDIE